MSYVDNVILAFSISEDFAELGSGGHHPIMGPINAWLREHADGQEFGPDLDVIDEAVGGYKALETPLYVAAFNYLPLDDFVAYLATLPWEAPEDVQIIIKGQHADWFEILTLQRDAA